MDSSGNPASGPPATPSTPTIPIAIAATEPDNGIATAEAGQAAPTEEPAAQAAENSVGAVDHVAEASAEHPAQEPTPSEDQKDVPQQSIEEIAPGQERSADAANADEPKQDDAEGNDSAMTGQMNVGQMGQMPGFGGFGFDNMGTSGFSGMASTADTGRIDDGDEAHLPNNPDDVPVSLMTTSMSSIEPSNEHMSNVSGYGSGHSIGIDKVPDMNTKEFLKSMTSKKNTTVDGQEPKRRGPKPKPDAQARKLETNRLAQRALRERKKLHEDNLEKEINSLKEENRQLRELNQQMAAKLASLGGEPCVCVCVRDTCGCDGMDFNGCLQEKF